MCNNKQVNVMFNGTAHVKSNWEMSFYKKKSKNLNPW